MIQAALAGLVECVKSAVPERFKEPMRRIRAALLSLDLLWTKEFVLAADEVAASEDISIIVAIHDSPEELKRCLNSLVRYAGNAQIILVDDASGDRKALELLEEFHRQRGWILVRHDKPLGHSRACESGSKRATRPYLCLLNSDTVVTPWSWASAKEAFDLLPGVAVTGPTTSHAATIQVNRRARLCRHYWTDAQINSFAKQWITKLPQRSWIDLPEVGGFALFIRRSIWVKLAGFDPNLPDYGNESELCRRVVQQGHRILWTRNSYIHHLGSRSYGRAGLEFVKDRSNSAHKYINSKFSQDRDPVL